VLIECQHCGAPLEASDDARQITCAYCGRQQEVRRARTLSMQLPPGWQPPHQWTAPQQFGAQGTYRFDSEAAARSGKRVLVFVGLSVLLTAIVPIIIVSVVTSQVSSTIETATSSGPNIQIPSMPNMPVNTGGGASVQSMPIECIGSAHLVRTNQDVQVTGPIAVIVRDRCSLNLMNSEVGGNDGITVEGSGRLHMINGTIRAHGTALRASGGAHVTLMNVDIEGEAGVVASDDANVTITNGSFDVKGMAVSASGNARVRAVNAGVTGSVEQSGGATVDVIGH